MGAMPLSSAQCCPTSPPMVTHEAGFARCHGWSSQDLPLRIRRAIELVFLPSLFVSPRRIHEAVTDMTRIVAGNLLTMSSPTLYREAEGVLSMLRSLSEGVGPSPEAADTFSDFFKLCLKRMECFFTWTKKVSGSGAPTLVFGRPALMLKFDACQEKVTQGEKLDLKELAPLRTFGWMLVPDQRKAALKWIQAAALVKASTFQMIRDGAADEAAESEEPAPVSAPTRVAKLAGPAPAQASNSGASSSNSSSLLRLVPPASGKRVGKASGGAAGGTEAAAPVDPHASLAKFFKRKT